MQHKLTGDTLTLTRNEYGIRAQCICGWVSAGHFSIMGASVAFQTHLEDSERKSRDNDNATAD